MDNLRAAMDRELRNGKQLRSVDIAAENPWLAMAGMHDPNDPLVLLSVFTPAAGWATYPVWRVSDGVTRPILFIDQSNFVLHVFASSSVSGGRILEKTSPINSISFAVGTGTTFMKDGGSNSLNNATSTKQNLTSASGLVILASNDTTGYYWHNYEPF